jgi:hypothetical protein
MKVNKEPFVVLVNAEVISIDEEDYDGVEDEYKMFDDVNVDEDKLFDDGADFDNVDDEEKDDDDVNERVKSDESGGIGESADKDFDESDDDDSDEGEDDDSSDEDFKSEELNEILDSPSPDHKGLEEDNPIIICSDEYGESDEE